MADKQLTVAELMARAQKENPDSQPRRRRRRSLDEGGVSVAELTGSLKAVDARPAEVKHSSVPIDAEPDKPETTEPEKTAPKAATSAEPVKSVKTPGDAKVVKAAEPAKQDEKTDQPQKIQKTRRPEVPEEQPQDKPKPETVTSTQRTPVTAPSEQSNEPQQNETRGSSSFKAVAPQPSKTEQTGPISRVVTFGDRPEASPHGPEQLVRDEDAEKHPAPRGAEADTETTQETPVVGDEHLPEQPVYRNDGTDQVEADNSVNPIMLVLLVFAGLVVGVLMFLGFQYLWASLNPFLVGVLALAVTGGVVALVRAMKTGRDALTMTLAALAGAAMTFGPALVTAI